MDHQQSVLRYTSLAVLTLQTTMTVLTMRYSRKKDPNNPTVENLYIASTLIVVAEIIKLNLCLVLLLIQKQCSVTQSWKVLANEVFYKPFETAKLAIPSTLYTLQNNLIILALSYLDAATYQVTYQLKILTTAFFSVCLLRKDLRALQWLALVILMFGVVLVQFPPTTAKSDDLPITSYRMVGLVAVLVSSVSSGFAGVYYEKLLKESAQPSIVIRNVQLGMFSIVFACIGVIITDREAVLQRGFLSGYTPIVWVVVMLQASGGLLVAAVIKYADNILKGFATSVSIILSCLFSYIVFGDLDLDLYFVIGTTLVIGATFLYGVQSHGNSSTLPTSLPTEGKPAHSKASNDRNSPETWNSV